MVVVRGREWGGMGSWCLWYRNSVREGEKVLEMDGGDSHKKVNIPNATH